MTTFKPSDMHFVPLGGSDEIGMNANLYHFDSSWLMVDLGISFPDETMTGADVVLPDISFIEKRRDSLCGLVLTHAHEDHFGAIPYLWDSPWMPDLRKSVHARLSKGEARGQFEQVAHPDARDQAG